MPQSGPSSTPTEDQTGQGGEPANVAGQAAGARTGPGATRVTARLAHRTRAVDVFPAKWIRLSELAFRVTAHWPADHSFFGPADDRHQDPMIVGETLRQTTLALAHAEFGAPLDTHFVMWDLSVAADPSGLLLADAAEPVTIDVVCSEVRRRGRGLSSMRTTMEFRRAGRLVARGTGSTGCTSPAAYRRLRARQLDVMDSAIPLLPPFPRTGRPRPRGGRRPRPRRPPRHLAPAGRHRPPRALPRPNDHVPGMVLFEAARQAATAASGRRSFLPADMAASFSRYAELDSPCLLEAEVLDKDEAGAEDGEVTVQVSGRQNGKPVFTATLTSAPHGRAPVRSPL
ncbi:ScbA/BarX family gamma-butyrolactone biosynthesis protein [Streptomyces sp. GD-15H]|uniref:ScbA/BarX family gamma-butyrolactone biosynthesis protein n=1 Tax=Streptomyces sp. GD-15H TaxID=3129112 RepID=UPI003245EACB